MKKALSLLLACLMMLSLSAALAESSELVDGKFTETRQITVEIYDRNNDGGTDPENNVWTDYIKKGMLEKYNVEVTFVPVGRWTETDDMNNLLAAGDAPDVCVTYSYPTIQTYANMGGVIDLAPLLAEYKDLLPNLWDLLGDENIYWDLDPETGNLWAIEALRADDGRARINTFVREDWLKKLDMAAPTTEAEFEAMLIAFKDNAELLLGEDAASMIPFSISYDVGWRADHLLTSYMPSDLSDKDAYINGFDDRNMLYPGFKEGVRKLNEWYNKGLIWQDFAIYGSGDTTEDNLIKAGFVGAFMHNWDYPYRSGIDGIHYALQQIDPEAGYIAIESFLNDAGEYKKFLYSPTDRKVFFPSTNDEPLASLLYVDFISDLETRKFMQIGVEGINHTVLETGAIQNLGAQGEYIQNSLNNIDYTITINGLDLGDADLNAASLALGYGYVDARYIKTAFDAAMNDGYSAAHINAGAIQAEDGMGPALNAKRDTFLPQAIAAPVDQFDAVYDAGMEDYLASGGQAIIDERTEAYAKYYEQ
ncbi:MAG: extracellular solute-binding protein [Oscillospiraceae bacterium]|jgi:putative aldouronate transport system substrate-binding protein|nr:extracellular solute-binding protein [Oscillospiraceae bacterium]